MNETLRNNYSKEFLAFALEELRKLTVTFFFSVERWPLDETGGSAAARAIIELFDCSIGRSNIEIAEKVRICCRLINEIVGRRAIQKCSCDYAVIGDYSSCERLLSDRLIELNYRLAASKFTN